jgi:hypothetical protein
MLDEDEIILRIKAELDADVIRRVYMGTIKERAGKIS